MNDFNCAYHPERPAVTKCEQCGKMICLECKNVYHRIRSRGTSESRSTYSMRNELCTPCYKKVLQQEADHSMMGGIVFGILGCVIFMIFMGAVSSMGSFGNSDATGMFGLFGIFFFIMIIIAVITGINKKHRLTQKISRIDQKSTTIASGTNYTQKFSNQPNKKVVYCQQCGQKMDYNAQFCPNCGDSTIDEQKMMN